MVNRKFVDRLSESKEEIGTGEGSSGGDKKTGLVEVHHVPFKIEYDGPAEVDVKFTRKGLPSSSGDTKVLTNQFRGRPLHGQEFQLPEDFEGVIVSDLKRSSGIEESSSSSSEGAEISVIKRFDSMTYWNWDKTPSGMDKHVKLLDWLEVSKVLHEPIQSSSN